MNALDLFAIFDTCLVNNTADLPASIDGKERKKTLLLRELTTGADGNLLRDLFVFIGWLIEDIERETFFSKQCDIRFMYIQNDLDLIKVS